MLPLPPFCTLFVDPLATVISIANANGEAELALTVPVKPSLKGLQVYDQWFAFDPITQHLIASDGGVATVGNPQLQVLGVTAPPMVVRGSTVTVRVRHAGTLRARDVCIGVVAANGQRGLIRAGNIVPVGATEVDIQGIVQTDAPAGGGHVMVMRGDGNELTGPVGGAGGDWAWIGPDMPEAGGQGPSVQAPSTPPFHLPFVIDNGDVVVEVGSGTPTSGNARIDAHWNAGGKHYDSFLSPVPFASLNQTQFRDTILLPNLQSKYGALYPGLLQITADTLNGNPAVRIHRVSNATCTGVGGNVWF
jgi:hypothetical protein